MFEDVKEAVLADAREEAEIDVEEGLVASEAKEAGMFASFVDKAVAYGPAGAMAIFVETVLFWILFLLPTVVYLFHEQSNVWIPKDEECWKQFGSILGGAYLFSKIPPIEAVRWAWAFSMVPWTSAWMPDDLKEAMKEGMPSFMSSNDESDNDG